MFPIFTDGRLQTASGARTVLSAKTCENHMCVCVCDWIKRHKVNFTATFFVFFFFAISSAAHRNTCTAWIKIKCGWERTVQRSELTHSQQAQTNTQTHTLQHFCKPKEIHSCYKSTHTHTHTRGWVSAACLCYLLRCGGENDEMLNAAHTAAKRIFHTVLYCTCKTHPSWWWQ